MLLVSGSDPSFRVAREKAHFSGLKCHPPHGGTSLPHLNGAVRTIIAKACSSSTCRYGSTTDASTSTATLFSCVTPYWRMDALIVRKNSARFGPRARFRHTAIFTIWFSD